MFLIFPLSSFIFELWGKKVEGETTYLSVYLNETFCHEKGDWTTLCSKHKEDECTVPILMWLMGG